MVGDQTPGRPGFLPLNDAAVTTRGQTLPNLIRVRSSIGIEDVKRRRKVRIQDNEDSEGDDEDLESTAGSCSASLRNGSVGRRKGSVMSEYGSLLHTPQMRSTRLIGKPNPKYEWARYYKTDADLKRMKKPMYAFPYRPGPRASPCLTVHTDGNTMRRTTV